MPHGSQRDVVYPGWPIAPSYKSSNAGEREGLRVLANEYSCTHGAYINFWDPTPYLTHGHLDQADAPITYSHVTLFRSLLFSSRRRRRHVTADLLDLGSRLSGTGDLHNLDCRLSCIVVLCKKSSSGFQAYGCCWIAFSNIYFDTSGKNLFLFLSCFTKNHGVGFFSHIVCNNHDRNDWLCEILERFRYRIFI